MTSPIDHTSSEKLTREVIPLIGSSPDPITVYIDSQGGNVYFSERMYQTLKLPSQDSGQRSRLVTVGLNLAASAASDLLIAGDYALVYPHTVLLCHGVRQSSGGTDVTRETALDLAHSIARSNEQFALQLAENAISRFIFRFVTLRYTFEAIRQEPEKSDMSDTSIFLSALEPHVSRDLMEILNKAMINHLGNDLIDLEIREKLSGLDEQAPKTSVEFEALILECIIEFQKRDVKGLEEWSFRTQGLPDLESKFSILVSSYDEAHKKQIQKLVARWGEFLLSANDAEAFQGIAEPEKASWLNERVTGTVRSLWFLFVGVCRLLQENDNYLTGEEAYWIGLVDEVIGRPDLPNPRSLVEFAENLGT